MANGNIINRQEASQHLKSAAEHCEEACSGLSSVMSEVENLTVWVAATPGTPIYNAYDNYMNTISSISSQMQSIIPSLHASIVRAINAGGGDSTAERVTVPSMTLNNVQKGSIFQTSEVGIKEFEGALKASKKLLSSFSKVASNFNSQVHDYQNIHGDAHGYQQLADAAHEAAEEIRNLATQINDASQSFSNKLNTFVNESANQSTENTETAKATAKTIASITNGLNIDLPASSY